MGYRSSPGNMSSNTTRMGLGYLAVIETFLQDPRVPAEIRPVAMEAASAYAIANFLKGRDWRNLVQTLIRSRVASLPFVAGRLLMALRRLIWRRLVAALRRLLPPGGAMRPLRAQGVTLPAMSRQKACLRARGCPGGRMSVGWKGS